MAQTPDLPDPLSRETFPSASATAWPGFPVVGIGASAGGLEALKKLFAAMPPESGMAFVVVPHLDPAHESLGANARTRRFRVSNGITRGLPGSPPLHQQNGNQLHHSNPRSTNDRRSSHRDGDLFELVSDAPNVAGF